MIFIKTGSKRKRHGEKFVLVFQGDFEAIGMLKNALVSIAILY